MRTRSKRLAHLRVLSVGEITNPALSYCRGVGAKITGLAYADSVATASFLKGRKMKIPENVERDLMEAEFSIQEIHSMHPRDVFDNWLKYNGIIGYSDVIWTAAIELSGNSHERISA